MGYCISVCIEKGGVGKTVTVCNLAALMAQDGKRVLVVDMDAQGNCTYTLTGARVTDNTFDRAGVYDMFRAYGISGTQNYISRTQFDRIDSGKWLIEHDELRIVGKTTGDFHSSALTSGKLVLVWGLCMWCRHIR